MEIAYLDRGTRLAAAQRGFGGFSVASSQKKTLIHWLMSISRNNDRKWGYTGFTPFIHLQTHLKEGDARSFSASGVQTIGKTVKAPPWYLILGVAYQPRGSTSTTFRHLGANQNHALHPGKTWQQCIKLKQ